MVIGQKIRFNSRLPLPVRVLIGVMPCIISGRAIAVLLVATAAPATGRVLASPVSLLVGGWLWLIGPSGWAHILGEGFLARDASVIVVVVHHNLISVIVIGTFH